MIQNIINISSLHLREMGLEKLCDTLDKREKDNRGNTNGLFGLYSSIMLNSLLHYTMVTAIKKAEKSLVLPFYPIPYLVNNKTDPQKSRTQIHFQIRKLMLQTTTTKTTKIQWLTLFYVNTPLRFRLVCHSFLWLFKF